MRITNHQESSERLPLYFAKMKNRHVYECAARAQLDLSERVGNGGRGWPGYPTNDSFTYSTQKRQKRQGFLRKFYALVVQCGPSLLLPSLRAAFSRKAFCTHIALRQGTRHGTRRVDARNWIGERNLLNRKGAILPPPGDREERAP